MSASARLVRLLMRVNGELALPPALPRIVDGGAGPSGRRFAMPTGLGLGRIIKIPKVVGFVIGIINSIHGQAAFDLIQNSTPHFLRHSAGISSTSIRSCSIASLNQAAGRLFESVTVPSPGIVIGRRCPVKLHLNSEGYCGMIFLPLGPARARSAPWQPRSRWRGVLARAFANYPRRGGRLFLDPSLRHLD